MKQKRAPATVPIAIPDRGSAREPDHALTGVQSSQTPLVRKSAVREHTIILPRRLSGRDLKNWRLAHGYSAKQLGTKLNVSRSYVKSIEGGSLPASQKLIERFETLRQETNGSADLPIPEPPHVIITRHRLPERLEIAAKPRKCRERKCKVWFVPVVPSQRYCSEHHHDHKRRRGKR